MNPPKKKLRLSGTEVPNYDFSTLPNVALTTIFKYLDFKTIIHCATLCKAFYRISNDSAVYRKVIFKYNMDKKLLSNYISKITSPKHLTVEYKYCDNDVDIQDNYKDFDDYVTAFIKKSGGHLSSIHFESCGNDEILNLFVDCPNLTSVNIFRCKGSFQSLTTLKNLKQLHLVLCSIPNNIIQETLQNNAQLKALRLYDNSNIDVNIVCESISKFNTNVQDFLLCEKNEVNAKSFKALARCYRLRVLELTGGPHHNDPEDALQQIAAGCPQLEKLSLYGWKKINDENLMPILHSCTQLKHLDLRGVSITIKSCREAALSLPFLHTLDVYKCDKIKKSQIAKLQKDFAEIRITNN